jgi:hypothetical protein
MAQYGGLSYFIEVHDGSMAAGPLWSLFGIPSGPNTILWQNGSNFEHGWNPTVAASGPTTVEVHNSQYTAGPLWYDTGVTNEIIP